MTSPRTLWRALSPEQKREEQLVPLVMLAAVVLFTLAWIATP